MRLGEEGQYTIGETRFEDRFGPARLRGGPLDQRHFDVAHSLQVVLEETVIELARWLHGASGCDDLCLAGGVALNCVMNARLRDRGPFKRIWVQPAAGDAGTAPGAALWIDARERGTDRRDYVMDHAFLGPSFTDDEIEAFLRWSKLPYRRLGNVAEEVADILARDLVIGWFQGRMEFGPRALGPGRSWPRRSARRCRRSSTRSRTARISARWRRWSWRRRPAIGSSAPGSRRSCCSSTTSRPRRQALIPAVRHVDGTARIQTIRRDQNPALYDLIRAFRARTGVPVLVNTSFNTRGEPVVCTPRDAVESFWTSPLDALVIGSFLLEKPGER